VLFCCWGDVLLHAFLAQQCFGNTVLLPVHGVAAALLLPAACWRMVSGDNLLCVGRSAVPYLLCQAGGLNRQRSNLTAGVHPHGRLTRDIASTQVAAPCVHSLALPAQSCCLAGHAHACWHGRVNSSVTKAACYGTQRAAVERADMSQYRPVLICRSIARTARLVGQDVRAR
jgi:hypothetical protein